MHQEKEQTQIQSPNQQQTESLKEKKDSSSSSLEDEPGFFLDQKFQQQNGESSLEEVSQEFKQDSRNATAKTRQMNQMRKKYHCKNFHILGFCLEPDECKFLKRKYKNDFVKVAKENGFLHFIEEMTHQQQNQSLKNNDSEIAVEETQTQSKGTLLEYLKGIDLSYKDLFPKALEIEDKEEEISYNMPRVKKIHKQKHRVDRYSMQAQLSPQDVTQQTNYSQYPNMSNYPYKQVMSQPPLLDQNPQSQILSRQFETGDYNMKPNLLDPRHNPQQLIQNKIKFCKKLNNYTEKTQETQFKEKQESMKRKVIKIATFAHQKV